MTAEDKNSEWHLSKSVPITIIVAVFLQTCTLVWHGSRMRADVDMTMRDVAAVQQEVHRMRDAASVQAIQMGRIDENIREMRASVERLNAQLERYIQSGNR